MNDNQLIIGLGTGRSGTVSLSMLLNEQNNCVSSHESLKADTWGQNFSTINNIIKQHFINSKFVADTASYNLPYVDDFISHYPNVKFIILKRNKIDTVKSFMYKTHNRNHWQTHDGIKYNRCRWDKSFPDFKAKNKQHAIELYWEMYYDLCSKINHDQCFYINTTDLNNESTCIKMLQWCGFTNPIYKKIHTNERR
jgi:hypothetical protein